MAATGDESTGAWIRHVRHRASMYWAYRQSNTRETRNVICLMERHGFRLPNAVREDQLPTADLTA